MLEPTLVAYGCTAVDAAELDKEFGKEPEQEFMAGLDMVAESINANQKPGQLPPGAEPWRTIHGHIMANGSTPEQAFESALGLWQAPIQAALQSLVSLAVGKQAHPTNQPRTTKKKRHKTADYVAVLKQLGYSVRMNDMNDDIEINGERLRDGVLSKIKCQLSDRGFFKDDVEDVIRSEAENNRYHPLREYINQLAWDGQPHIATLAGHIKDEKGIFGTWIRRWLIGAVGKIREQEENVTLILDAPQDIGKSWLARWLCPLPRFFIEMPANFNDKDNQIRMMSVLVWELSEFGQTIRRNDRETLKSFLTIREVRARKPFGRMDIVKPVTCNFIGTANNDSGLLDDPTGSRRFVIAKITQIDFGYRSLDVNQVWAEANAAWLSGERGRLTDDEKKISLEINEHYEIDDPIEQELRRIYRIDKSNLIWWTSTRDIVERLETKLKYPSTKSLTMALSESMTRIGLRKKKDSSDHWGYSGITL
jgi:hypothetical protein